MKISAVAHPKVERVREEAGDQPRGRAVICRQHLLEPIHPVKLSRQLIQVGRYSEHITCTSMPITCTSMPSQHQLVIIKKMLPCAELLIVAAIEACSNHAVQVADKLT